MLIPPEIVEQIKQVADIQEVVGDFVALKRKGNNLWAPCPFHDEKTASFSVSPSKGIYKCFGCGKAGDVVRFVMDVEKASYPEALRWLAKRYSITIPDTEAPRSEEDQQRQQERDSLFILTDWAKEFFKRQLTTSDEGQGIGGAYLRERGIQKPAVEAFELGYSLDQWDALMTAAQKAGFQLPYLEQTGLVVTREDNPDRKYDRFRGRVMFPIHNAAGRVVGFGARTLRRDDKAGAKYLNSPESSIYHKGDVLYGLYQAREAIRRDDLCYLVEGYLDVISLWQGGVKNVVAISGTSLTENQVKLLGRYAKNVTMLLDGDAAGLRASKRGVDLLLAGGLNVRVCPLPQGEDPDSFIQKTGDTAFREHLTRYTQDFITFKARAWQQEAAGDPVKKAEAIRDVMASIARVQDGIKRSVFIQECSRLFGLDEQVLLTEYNRIVHDVNRPHGSGTGQRPAEGRDLPPAARGVDGIHAPPDVYADPLFDEAELEAAQAISEPDYLKYEHEIIRLILNYPDHTVLTTDNQPWLLAPYVLTLLAENGSEFRDPDCARLATEMQTFIEQGTLPQPDYFTGHADGRLRRLATNLLIDRWSLSDNWENHHIVVPREPDVLQIAADTAVLRMSRCLVQDKLQELGQQLMTAQEAEEQNAILSELMRLKQVDVQIGKLLGMVVG